MSNLLNPEYSPPQTGEMKRSQPQRHKETKAVEYDDADIDWHSHPVTEKTRRYPMGSGKSGSVSIDCLSSLPQQAIPRKKKSLVDFWGYFIQLLMLTVLIFCIFGFSMLPSKYLVPFPMILGLNTGVFRRLGAPD
jgi:hypothetical protein